MNLTTYVAAALLLRGDRLLVAQRKTLLWEFPGGKIETGEDPRDTVRRELQEEHGTYLIFHWKKPAKSSTIYADCCRKKAEYWEADSFIHQISCITLQLYRAWLGFSPKNFASPEQTMLLQSKQKEFL